MEDFSPINCEHRQTHLDAMNLLSLSIFSEYEKRTGLRAHEKRLLEHLCVVRKLCEKYEHFVEEKTGIRVTKTNGIKEQESRKKIEIDVPIGAEAIQEQEKRPRKMKRPTWKIKMEIKNKTGQIPVFHEIFLIFEIGHSDFKYISKTQNQGTQRFSL